MLDVAGSLTVQESILPQSQLLMARCPEKFLRADWPSDATWVHEMLDDRQLDRAGVNSAAITIADGAIPSSCVQIGQVMRPSFMRRSMPLAA